FNSSRYILKLTYVPYTTLFRSRRKGKVYRSFFGIQNHYTANEIQNKAIPTLFRDPFIKDVSANYFWENNVQIPIQSECDLAMLGDRKSTRLNSSHVSISYAVFC